MVKNKTTFYILSFTWGIIMTLVGCIVAAVLLVVGYRPNKYGYCWHFEIGKNWGGVSLGPVFLTCKNAPNSTKNHEHGHSLQNCIYGPFMVVISIMSFVRYWYFMFKYYRKGLVPPTDYDAIWFEADATERGTDFMMDFSY